MLIYVLPNILQVMLHIPIRISFSTAAILQSTQRTLIFNTPKTTNDIDHIRELFAIASCVFLRRRRMSTEAINNTNETCVREEDSVAVDADAAWPTVMRSDLAVVEAVDDDVATCDSDMRSADARALDVVAPLVAAAASSDVDGSCVCRVESIAVGVVEVDEASACDCDECTWRADVDAS
jgi:hypothetical protein